MPQAVGKWADRLAHVLADGQGIRAILSQNAVEEEKIGGELLDLRALRLERGLGGAYEQSENQSGYSGNQPDAKPHHVLGVLVQMVSRQGAAKQRAKQNAAQRRHEYGPGQKEGAHGSSDASSVDFLADARGAGDDSDFA